MIKLIMLPRIIQHSDRWGQSQNSWYAHYPKFYLPEYVWTKLNAFQSPMPKDASKESLHHIIAERMEAVRAVSSVLEFNGCVKNQESMDDQEYIRCVACLAEPSIFPYQIKYDLIHFKNVVQVFFKNLGSKLKRIRISA